MLGMPTFDLTTERGKQDFQKWITFSIKKEINSYARQVLGVGNEGTSGGFNVPIGPAGGGLTGTYPDPLIAPNMTGITSISTPGVINFDTLNPGIGGVGSLVWNDTEGTLEFGLKGGSVTLPIGQEQVTLVKHADNSGLTKGKAVYVAGADGSNHTVRYAQANAESTSSKTFGVMTESATGGSKAFCTTQGVIHDIDTSTLTEGYAVWLSPTVSGGLTTTKPSAPNHLVLIGWCIRSHATQGVLFVHVVNGFELDELHDVSIVGKTDGDLLKYDSATGLWKNAAQSTLSFFTTAQTANTVFSGPATGSAAAPTFRALVANDIPTLTLSKISDAGTAAAKNIPATGNASVTEVVYGTDTRLTDSRTPTGSAGGDLAGTYPNPTLGTVGTSGTYTKVTTDTKGRVTSGTNPTTLSGYGITDAANITHASTHIPGGSDVLDFTKIIAKGTTLPTSFTLYPAGTLFAFGSSAPYLLYRSTGTAWEQLGSASTTVSDTAPSSPQAGALWYKSSNGKTYIYYADGTSNQWVEIGENAQVTIPGHAGTHIRGGSDIIDGDRLTVDYVPTNYTRNSAATGAGDNTDLTAHLSGIDTFLTNKLKRIGYQTATSLYTISATSTGTATNIFSNISWTADGTTTYEIEFFCPEAFTAAAAGAYIYVWLVNSSGTELARLCTLAYGDGTRSSYSALYGKYYYTPSAGSVSVNARGTQAGGNGGLNGGPGGTGSFAPMFLNVKPVFI